MEARPVAYSTAAHEGQTMVTLQFANKQAGIISMAPIVVECQTPVVWYYASG